MHLICLYVRPGLTYLLLIRRKYVMETRPTLITWQEDIALKRYQMIAPLLEADLDDARKIQRRREIAEEHDISERTLRRYEIAFKERGFNGLKPAKRSLQLDPSLPENFAELVSQAIQLKREVPTRSVRQIIFILEGEGRVEPGVLKRSTLQRHLYEAGFSQKQMRKYIEGQKSSSKRFCKPHRMMLLQAVIKYGPKLPIGRNGKMVQTYLSSIIDDHSRYILDSRFYDNQEKTIVEDTFHRAILSYGTFDAAYCDYPDVLTIPKFCVTA